MADQPRAGPTAAALVTRIGLALAAVVVVALLVLTWHAGREDPWLYGAGALVLVALVVGLGAILVLVARPVDQLARDLEIVARDNPHHVFRLPARHGLARLAATAEQLRARVAGGDAREQAARAVATAEIDRRQRQLEAILLELTEGVVVCDLSHRLLLYNQAAADAVDPPLAFGLGRSVLLCLAEEPIAHHLERLTASADPHPRPARFVCGTVDGRRLLQARMALMREADERPNGYVLTLADVSGQMQAVAAREELLARATEGQRAPLANLRAAAETLAAHAELGTDERRPFERVVLQESRRLSTQLEELAEGYARLGVAPWEMTEIHSTDLIASLRRRLGAEGLPRLTATGVPLWLLGDSLALLGLLEQLARLVLRASGAEALDIAVAPAGAKVELDLVWAGPRLAADVLEAELDRPIAAGLGPLTGRSVLRRHGTDAWCQAGRPGESLVRVPLPAAEPVSATPARETRPPRPEFYDFDLIARPPPSPDLAARELADLDYLVFDFETTGLRPSAGDRPVSLGAVRVVNGRVLTMETFERLIHPGRAIPAESIRFHGITDAMVQGKPPYEVVLAQFHRLAADSVLVAHNAAFELAFLEIGTHETGLVFEQPVLDTLLLSAYLDGEEEDHSLDAIMVRLGLEMPGRRHTALTDALVTAAILVRQIERLAERDLTTLGEVVSATNMVAQIRANRAHF